MPAWELGRTLPAPAQKNDQPMDQRGRQRHVLPHLDNDAFATFAFGKLWRVKYYQELGRSHFRSCQASCALYTHVTVFLTLPSVSCRTSVGNRFLP